MKRIVKRSGAVLLAICLVMSVPMGFASGAEPENGGYTIDTPYQYPITPGTDEWKAILDHGKKIEMCQIPEDILPLMTTQALAKTVVAYPFLVDMYAWDSTSIGYGVVSLTFNGLQELERRPDGLSALEALRQQEAGASDEFLLSIYLNTIIGEMKAREEPSGGSARATEVYAHTPGSPMESLKGYEPFN